MPYTDKKTKKPKKSFSSESLEFRRLSKKDKYKKLLQFCKTHKQSPRTYKRPEEERVLGQFLVNTKALIKKGSPLIEDWEHDYINKVSDYEIHQRNPIIRLKDILEWTKSNEKTPSQSSRDDEEKRLGQSLNSIKLLEKRNRLNDEEQTLLSNILEYRTNHQRTRSEKLGDVLEFCRTKNRTPKQHVTNKHEKRLAEFLTTTKGLLKNPDFELDEESNKLFNEILKFAPPTRESRIKELYEFASTEHRKPSTSSEDDHERKLAAYLSKMKTALKRDQLSDKESDMVSEILTLCKIKTREQKLNDLLQWVLKNDRLPSFSNEDKEEKRFAMFMNNIKQVKKKKPTSLTVAENNMIKAINSCIHTKQEA